MAPRPGACACGATLARRGHRKALFRGGAVHVNCIEPVSPSHFPELNATLLQLLSELQDYEAHVHRLARDWESDREPELFGEFGRAMDRMRGPAGAVPLISVQWLMLLISHTELMHNLWRASRGEPLDVATQVQDHLSCVHTLATRCRVLLQEPGRVLH